jgi:hypothetical protein
MQAGGRGESSHKRVTGVRNQANQDEDATRLGAIPLTAPRSAFDMAANFFQARAPTKKKQAKDKEPIPSPSLQPWVEK